MKIEEDLRNICKNVSRNLVLIPYENNTKVNKDILTTKLIFPAYKNDKKEVRISEQESRILFCRETEKYNKKYYYAIEVPTASKYRFTGKIQCDPKGQSALSDFSLFSRTSNSDNRIFKQIVNIEFKAHNVGVLHIMKDLLKLAAESTHGLFFHTLKNINKGTLNNEGKDEGILDKYRRIKEYKKEFQKPLEDGEEKFILFAICIIERKALLMKTFRKSNLDSIGKFFSINYDNISKTNPPKLNNDWTQIHFK